MSHRKPPATRHFNPGDKVRLTAVFLRSTGQAVGGEGRRVWTVRPCGCSLCASGRYVAVNEPSVADVTSPRHIASANLIAVGQHDRSNA